MSDKSSNRSTGPGKSGDGSPENDGQGDDEQLFRRAMADARPLNREFIEPARRRIPAKARFTRRDERAVLDESLEASVADTEAGSGDTLSFCRASVGRRVFRKLARGKFSVQSELDLHGMTVDQARDALLPFIESSLARGLSCVRVIHGKGLGSGQSGPVLKRKVDAWLRRWDPVLAFVSAQPVDGGSGAVYVLLKT